MRKRGFSIIELIMAALIFSVGMIVLLGVFSSSTRNAVMSRNRTVAIMLVHSLMDEVQAHPYGSAEPPEWNAKAPAKPVTIYAEGNPQSLQFTQSITYANSSFIGKTAQDYDELTITLNWEEGVGTNAGRKELKVKVPVMAMKSGKRGMTLLEMTVYSFLALLLLGLVVSLFVIGWSASSTTTANYFLSKDVETTLEWLRRDLQQTALASIKNYPASQSGEPPGIACASTLDPADPGKMQPTTGGNPTWAAQVFYTFVPGTTPDTGSLVRWTRALSGTELTGLPGAPIPLPSAQSDKSHSRTVLTNLVAPSQTIRGVSASGNIDAFGGLRLQFVRREGGEGSAATLSDHNPNDVTLTQAGGLSFKGNTKLVQVDLKVLSRTTSGKPSYYSISSRFCPLY